MVFSSSLPGAAVKNDLQLPPLPHSPWSPDLAVPAPPHLYCDFVQYLMHGRVAAGGIIG
jgi:hypothetical protein